MEENNKLLIFVQKYKNQCVAIVFTNIAIAFKDNDCHDFQNTVDMLLWGGYD